METKTSFNKLTAILKENGSINYNRIYKWGNYTIGNVAFHNNTWKLLNNKLQHNQKDFDLIADREYKPLAEFRTREELWNYLKLINK